MDSKVCVRELIRSVTRRTCDECTCRYACYGIMRWGGSMLCSPLSQPHMHHVHHIAMQINPMRADLFDGRPISSAVNLAVTEKSSCLAVEYQELR